MECIEEMAPTSWAAPWDSVGLQVGSPDRELDRVLVTLDVTPEALELAGREGAGLCVTHHPLFLRPPQSFDPARPPGDLVAGALLRDLAVYVAHTNWDVAPGGVSDVLAEILELEDVDVLEQQGHEHLFKLAVFVPPDHADEVHDAVAAAGGGVIGDYTHCAFQSPGTGTFRPRQGADPFIGRVGELERVEELRLEVLVPARCLDGAVAAMKAAHPYEEVAYDVYPLGNRGKAYGLGRLGRLAEPLAGEEFAAVATQAVRGPGAEPRVAGRRERVSRVAVIGGSGGGYVQQAAAAGADALVTGDVGHHEALLAVRLGLLLVDVGHHASERPGVAALADRLSGALTARGLSAEVFTVFDRGEAIQPDPLRFLQRAVPRGAGGR